MQSVAALKTALSRLQHGLKEMNGRRLTVPAKPGERPDRDRLDERFSRFRDAA